MKTNINIIAMGLLLALSLSITSTSTAQYRRPAWGSVQAYRTHPRQIYYPQYNCYYDVQQGNYIYIDGGRWMMSVNLPYRLRNVSFQRTPYVEMNINGFAPERYNAEHREKYRYYENENNYNQSYSNNRREVRRDWRDNDRNNRYENKGWKHERHEDRD